MSTEVVDKDMKAVWNTATGKLEIDDVPVDNATMIDAIQKAIRMGWSNERIIKVIGWTPEIIDKQRSLCKKGK